MKARLTGEGPAAFAAGEKHRPRTGQAGNKSIYQHTIGSNHWLAQGAADVVTVTMQNVETSFLV